MALNFWQFLLLATCAILLVPVTRGWLRTALFLAINLTFIWTYWAVSAMPVGLGFCLAGYACARLVRGRGTEWLVASLLVLTAAFVFLRGYTIGSPSAGAGCPESSTA